MSERAEDRSAARGAGESDSSSPCPTEHATGEGSGPLSCGAGGQVAEGSDVSPHRSGEHAPEAGDGPPRYPLGEHAAARIRSRTGVPLDEITLEAVRAGRIDSDDLRIDRTTLELQSQVAAGAGYRQLAENLQRAAELVEIPHTRLLEIYDALRPRRSTYEELLALSDELETEHGAAATARFIREAAAAYRAGSLLRPDGT